MPDVLMMANVGYQILSWNVSQTLQSRDYKSPPLVVFEAEDEDEGMVHSGSPSECMGGQPPMYPIVAGGMQGKGCICYEDEENEGSCDSPVRIHNERSERDTSLDGRGGGVQTYPTYQARMGSNEPWMLIEEKDGDMDGESGGGNESWRTSLQGSLPDIEGDCERQQSAPCDCGGAT